MKRAVSKKNNSVSKTKPRICLNMIVKNEAHIIRETLDSIKKYINYWVICDTGSTDGTQDLIKNFFKEAAIPGELHEHEWKDFGYNRSKALEAAYGKSEYVFIIDADDLIVGDFNFPKKMKADYYMLKFLNPESSFSYERYQIFKNNLRWEYVGVLHEYPECIDKNNPTKDPVNNIIPGNYYVNSRRMGDRSKDEKKYIRDALKLSDALEKEIAAWNNAKKINKSAKANIISQRRNAEVLIPRYCFYTAQSYRDYDDVKNAIKYYKMYTTIKFDVIGYKSLNRYDQEVYYAYCELGRLMERDGSYSLEEIVKVYNGAVNALPERVESYFRLGSLYENNKKYMEAYIAYKLGASKTYPSNLTFFINKDVHLWKCKFKYAQLAVHLGKIQEAKDVLAPLLSNKMFRRTPVAPRALYESLRFSDPDEIKKNHSMYNKEIVDRITTRVSDLKNRGDAGLVTLTVTTCKRFDLFERTINSFMNACQDILFIDRYLCIDDNSDENDRAKMQELYPFFEFVWKTPEQKGHVVSMNIIRDMVKTPYVLQMEDDWFFLNKRDYIRPAICILEQKTIIPVDPIPSDQVIDKREIGQVVFNRNYQEEFDKFIPGGYSCIMREKNLIQTKSLDEEKEDIPKSFEYILHEHYPEKSDKLKEISMEYDWINSVYWPHFSLNPSIIKTSVYKKLGPFPKTTGFFEREYADKYIKNGYVTSFFDDVCCTHIGKLIRERNDTTKKNAYELNNEGQFGDAICGNMSKASVNHIDGYDFFPNEDSFGNDIDYYPNKTINELKELSNKMDDCAGFNTYGYLKHKICNREKFIRLQNKYYATDGLYVKKINFKNIVFERVDPDAEMLKHKIWCINLKRREERKKHMETIFSQIGLEGYNFFEAVDGYSLKFNNEIKKLFNGNSFGWLKGVIGCALSHYNLITQLVEDDQNDLYVIFEDDISSFDPNFMEKFKHVIKSIDINTHDVTYMGYTKFNISFNLQDQNEFDILSNQHILRPLNKIFYAGGSFGYVISKKGARKILEYISRNNIKHAIDFLTKIIPDLNVYELDHPIVFSDCKWNPTSDVESDIQFNTERFDPRGNLEESNQSISDTDPILSLPPDHRENYVFVPYYDSFGFDIKNTETKSVSEICKAAEADPDCIAFNTNGWLKYSLSPCIKKSFDCDSPLEGLYINSERLFQKMPWVSKIYKDVNNDYILGTNNEKGMI